MTLDRRAPRSDEAMRHGAAALIALMMAAVVACGGDAKRSAVATTAPAKPKTSQSRRRVGLTLAGIAALRQHRVRQAEERLRLGAAWQNDDMVFTDGTGRPIDATKFLRNSFAPLLKAAGLPRMRFHDLRHTAATLLLGRGVHPKDRGGDARA